MTQNSKLSRLERLISQVDVALKSDPLTKKQRENLTRLQGSAKQLLESRKKRSAQSKPPKASKP